MPDTILDKLTALGLSLPTVPTPIAAYVNCVRSGNLLHHPGRVTGLDGCRAQHAGQCDSGDPLHSTLAHVPLPSD